ncbi:hypothetical protein C2G38_2197732 [Gigaspora rosea]|uniref:Alpha/Beta hydrolase protein n=1 Tax=Gigaspora rosea TaxID=44941 RepID=A0A397UUM3_9GLOM|nr:hypothetical protein C2G38_2197732 [Gigaspora rosea]
MPVRPNYRAPEITYRPFGFDKLGPSSIPYLQIYCWCGIEEALQKLGAKVVVTKVPRIGCIRARAQVLHQILETNLSGCGLDCRYLITHLLLRNLLFEHAIPHHSSPFMDWCRDNIGVGEINQTFEEAAKVVDGALKQMAEKTRGHQNLNDSRSSLLESRVQEQSLRSPSQAENIKSFNIPISFNLPNFHLPNFNLSLPNINLSNISLSSLSSIPQTTYTILHPITRALIQAFDTPAYSNLTTDYCVNYFNKSTPNNPSVAYYSYGPNDGLVGIKSAQWGKYMGTVECDHWDLTNRWRLKIGSSFDPVEFYLNVATFLVTEGY